MEKVPLEQEASKEEVVSVDQYVEGMKQQNYPDAKSELDNVLKEANISMSEALKDEILTKYNLGPGNAPE
jgi:hypothetical protein